MEGDLCLVGKSTAETMITGGKSTFTLDEVFGLTNHEIHSSNKIFTYWRCRQCDETVGSQDWRMFVHLGVPNRCEEGRMEVGPVLCQTDMEGILIQESARMMTCS